MYPNYWLESKEYKQKINTRRIQKEWYDRKKDVIERRRRRWESTLRSLEKHVGEKHIEIDENDYLIIPYKRIYQKNYQKKYQQQKRLTILNKKILIKELHKKFNIVNPEYTLAKKKINNRNITKLTQRRKNAMLKELNKIYKNIEKEKEHLCLNEMKRPEHLCLNEMKSPEHLLKSPEPYIKIIPKRITLSFD